MQKSAKHFAEQLNKCLDDLGLPNASRERAVILSKMLHLPKQQAWGLIAGHVYPDEILLRQIANELEINLEVFK